MTKCLFNNVSRHYAYRHHPFNFASRSPSRRNVRDLVNQSHDKKLGECRPSPKHADDGMYVITRGCSQMSRVPQKINNIVEIFSFNGCRLRTPNVQGEGGRLNADFQKLAKSCGHLLCMTRTLIIPQLPHRPPKTLLLDPSPVEHITSVP